MWRKTCTQPSGIAFRCRRTCRHSWLLEGRAYDWTADGEPYVSDETAELFSVGQRPSTVEQVRERALDAVASEIGMMLAEEVVAAPMDIDLCMILGAGWPFYLGGITPYLDREGISERVIGHRFLPPGIASVAAE